MALSKHYSARNFTRGFLREWGLQCLWKVGKENISWEINGSHVCFNICTFYSCSMQNDNSLGGLRTKT